MSIGLKGTEIRVEKYDEQWAARFEKEKKELEKLLDALGCAVRIEHVGSTSVSDLAAKPIVDIAIGLPSRDHLGGALALLLKGGRAYLKWGNQPGMLLMANGNPREVFYHLVVVNSPAWIRLIQIRNQLRRYPLIATQYANLKAKLAGIAKTRLQYALGKKPLLSALLGRGMNQAIRKRISQNKWRTEGRLQLYLRQRSGRSEPAAPTLASRISQEVVAAENDPQ